MRTRAAWLSAVLVAFGLGIFSVGAPLAQTKTTIDLRNFEVLAVEGNRLVYRDQRGTHEITVPDDFRLNVDGKQMAVKELKPGMKGTATVTTTTTITPVTVTEVKQAVVVSSTPTSVLIRGTDGVQRRFTQSELDKRGIEIFKDGKLVRVSQLNPGDQLTGTILSSQPPSIVTETEVDAKMAKAEPAPAKVEPAPAKAEPAAPAAATAPPVVASTTPVAPSSPPMKAAPPEQSQSWLLWAAILIAIVVVAYLFMRKKKS
jgi:LPXTG-motif cell wall-anchored protein